VDIAGYATRTEEIFSLPYRELFQAPSYDYGDNPPERAPTPDPGETLSTETPTPTPNSDDATKTPQPDTEY